MIASTMILSPPPYKLKYDPVTDIAYCAAFSKLSRSFGWIPFYVAGVVLIFTEIALLLMFVTRLRKLKQEMEIHLQMNNASDSRSGVSAIEAMDSMYVTAGPDIEQIQNLHKLMKKQTILVCTAMSSTGVIWIGSIFYGDFAFESGWDNIVNSICVWMMFDVSEKYWKFCERRLCWCCYC